jgi:predicted permease
MTIRRFFRRGAEQAELEREIQAHIAQEVEDNLAHGMSEDEARRQAYVKFGSRQRLLEDAWQWNTVGVFDDVLRDVRYALRLLWRSPGFTAIAILVTALGIGANTTLFTVVRSVLLKPLPFDDSDRLVMLYEQSADGKHLDNPVAGGIYEEWQKQSRSFEQMAIWGGSGYNLSGTNGQLPEKVEAGKCSWNLFWTLGLQATLGRFFTADDDRPDANATVILTWSLWQRRFGGDPTIIGKDILLDGQAWTVIGVLPAWFSYPDPETQVWTPIRHETRAAAMQSLNNHQFRVIGRLRKNHTISQALTEVDTIEKRIRNQHPGLAATIGSGATIRPLLEEYVEGYKIPLYVLMAATGCFLLIACLNAANLLVARSAARRREFAIRAALGGSRRRLLREQLSESVVLSAMGGAGGIAIAWLAIQWLVRVRHDLPRVETVHIDALVLSFAAGITLASGIAAGLMAALGATGSRMLEVLQESSSSHSGGRAKAQLRKVLLSVEVGLTVMLLIAAGLLVKSYGRLRSSDLGCGTKNILTLRVDLPKPKYLAEQRETFFEQTIDSVRGLPGVEKAGMITVPPGFGYGSDDSFTISEHPPLPPGQVLLAIKRFADPDAFAAMQIPLLRGRTFNNAERLDQAHAVIISDLFAKRFFPDEDPIGKHLRVNLTDHEVAYEVAGIVGDTRFVLSRPAEPMMYFPLYSGIVGRTSIVIRSRHDPTSLALPVQKLIAGMDPDLPVSDVLTMEQRIAGSTINSSFTASLVVAFAVLSLLLAVVGLYGVLSYLVTQRTSEIGIRVALGAQRIAVLKLVFGDGLRPVMAGLIAGLGGGVATGRLIRSVLYGVEPLDGSVFAVGAIVLLLATTAACLVPAWRASRLDPVAALRMD